MAYALLADVQALIGAYFTIGASSTPTTAQVNAWLDQKSAKANAAMSRAGYSTVPATGVNDLLELKDAVAKATALQTLYVALGASNVPATSIEMLTGWGEWIIALGNGDTWLPDQSPMSSAAGSLTVGTITLRSSRWLDVDINDPDSYFERDSRLE